MWAIHQRLQRLLAERKITLEVDEETKRWLAEAARVIEAGSSTTPSGRTVRSATRRPSGSRASPLAPAPRPCYDVNGSPSSWTYLRGNANLRAAPLGRDCTPARGRPSIGFGNAVDHDDASIVVVYSKSERETAIVAERGAKPRTRRWDRR
jgi:hypothetical protein